MKHPSKPDLFTATPRSTGGSPAANTSLQPALRRPAAYSVGRMARWGAALGAACLLSACGGGGGGDGGSEPTPAPVVVLTAANDTLNLAAGQSGTLLANDRVGSAAAAVGTGGNVVFSLTSGALPTGVTVVDGVVTVQTAAVPGVVSLGYRICESTSPTNCANATASVTVPAQGSVTGRVVDAATALGIAGATVRAGTVTTTTDANGSFSLSGLPLSARLSVVFTARTHAETAQVITVETGRSTDVQARLLRVGTTATVAVDTGGTVTLPNSPARVVLPASAVQRADGSLPSGNITVRMTPINPAVDSSLMPGDFTTLVAGTPTPIESFGALNVELIDSAGAVLNLRSGQTATIRIPLATRSATAPATIPLFFFDNNTGRWVQEGTATLAGTAPNQYYEGTVAHFTTWNADQVMDTVRVSGCVADVNGVRQVGARVFSDGVDYSGTSSATTDASGNFSISLRRASVATLTALSGATLSNTLRASTGNADSTITACLALGQAGSVVTMKLTWGEVPADLDSHLVTPSGETVFYGRRGNPVAAPFANLDVDDTSSFGPEVITLTKLMVGTYKYAINNFSGQALGLFSGASTRVELSVPGRALELFVPPTTGETNDTNWWLLFEMDVDASCNITLRRTAAFSTEAPTAAATSTPVYCTRP